MITKTIKSAAEPRYEAPAVAVLEVRNEGVICASTQMFEEDNDTVLFGW